MNNPADTRIDLEQNIWRGLEIETYRTARGWWAQVGDETQGPFDGRGNAIKWGMSWINTMVSAARTNGVSE